MNKALFLDRDGVINVDYGHVYRIEDFDIYPGIIPLVKKYIEEGYLVVVVSNQAGIAKGMYTEKDLQIIDEHMKKEFIKSGVKIDASYYCVHGPNDNCSCRKPKPGLIYKAQKELNIDLEKSVLIGDKMSDLEAGYTAGIKKLMFRKGRYEEVEEDFDYERIDY